nr:hypothetical protein Iba_chr09aCG15470 [Ipomoea batatas]GME06854.1 hypothetical protein Iba_scaffold5206CG0040 [Ipomoea batatas]
MQLMKLEGISFRKLRDPLRLGAESLESLEGPIPTSVGRSWVRKHLSTSAVRRIHWHAANECTWTLNVDDSCKSAANTFGFGAAMASRKEDSPPKLITSALNKAKEAPRLCPITVMLLPHSTCSPAE